MLERIQNKVLITPKDITPSDPRLKILGVFNPGAIRYNDEIILLVRVAEAVEEHRADVRCSPRITSNEPEYVLDWFKIDESFEDQRKHKLTNGLYRLSSISHLELVRLSSDGYTVKSIEKHAQLFGNGPDENYGIEDPRITKIDDTFYITYVAVSSEMGVCTKLMSTKDFKTFERHGVICDWENKDVVLFPEKVGESYMAYHRPIGNLMIRRLSIMAAQSPDLFHWGKFTSVLQSNEDEPWSRDRIGAGTPPLKTKAGWLTLYHGVQKNPGDVVGTYRTGAFLADINDPTKILKHTSNALLDPSTEFEQKGFVDQVIFPTGIIQDEDNLYIYYGAADTVTAAMTVSLQEVLSHLM